MPFKSEAQRRLFYAKARRGEISDEKVREWERETPKGKKLPERKEAAWALGLVLGLRKVAYSGRSKSVAESEDTRVQTARELAAIKDPAERRRYLADMAAANHRLAMKTPKSVRESVVTQSQTSSKPA